MFADLWEGQQVDLPDPLQGASPQSLHFLQRHVADGHALLWPCLPFPTTIHQATRSAQAARCNVCVTRIQRLYLGRTLALKSTQPSPCRCATACKHCTQQGALHGRPLCIGLQCPSVYLLTA